MLAVGAAKPRSRCRPAGRAKDETTPSPQVLPSLTGAARDTIAGQSVIVVTDIRYRPPEYAFNDWTQRSPLPPVDPARPLFRDGSQAQDITGKKTVEVDSDADTA